MPQPAPSYATGTLVRPAAPVFGVGIRPTLAPLPLGRAQGAFVQHSSSDSSSKYTQSSSLNKLHIERVEHSSGSLPRSA